MKEDIDFKVLLESIKANDKKVLVLGLGISGLETLLMLKRLSIASIAAEKSSESDYLEKNRHKKLYQEVLTADVKPFFLIDSVKLMAFLDNIALAVISPGVPDTSPLLAILKDAGVLCTTELELGVKLLGRPWVMVTGSNGKSTTATLINELLKAGAVESELCGNIGRPVVSLVEDGRTESARAKNAPLVVETSSYQIERSNTLKPGIGVFLNIGHNHLERHKTIERYFGIKSQPLKAQSEDDYAVLNFDDPLVRSLQAQIEAKAFGFGARQRGGQVLSAGAYFDYRPEEGIDSVSVYLLGHEEHYDLSSLQIYGRHNRYNVAASILVARLSEVSPETIRIALPKFKGLEHRLEDCSVKDSHKVINDSKATTVAATIAAFKAVTERYPGKPLALMIGGRAKRDENGLGSWNEALELVSAYSRAHKDFTLICFGEDGAELAKMALSFDLSVQTARGLAEATELGLSWLGEDKVLVLSPGCASFDEFKSFEERGTFFKKLVCR